MEDFEGEALADFARRGSGLALDGVLDPIADQVSVLASDALGVEHDPTVGETWEVRGTRAALLAVRTYMVSQGVECEKTRGE